MGFLDDPMGILTRMLNRNRSGGGYGSSVGSVLGNAGSTIYGRSNPSAAGKAGSSLDQLFQRLMGSALSGGYSMPSMGMLEQQARSAVDLQYGPQEAAIRRAMSAAKSNAAYSKTAVGKLFEGLAGSYNTDKKETKHLYKDAKEGEKARLKDYADTTKQNYADSMDSLAESFKKLGIEAAAGDSTMGRLAQDEASNLQQATAESQTEQSALNQQETGDLAYWEKGKGTAQMEGTQRQADIQQVLSSFLMDKQASLEDLKAQRAAAYQSALSQLQQQVADQAAKQSQQTWSNLMQLANLQMRMNNSKTAQANKGYGKGLSGANNYLYQQFVNSQWGAPEAERYSGILQGIILNLPPGTSPEQAAQYAANEANRRGISPTVMARAMLAYQGRL